jgi:hypothetical protein
MASTFFGVNWSAGIGIFIRQCYNLGDFKRNRIVTP